MICTGLSDVHVAAISGAIDRGLQETPGKHKPWHIEGDDSRRWILLDYVNVVVHVFQKGTREYYSLEHFWGDAPREEIAESPEAGRGGTR